MPSQKPPPESLAKDAESEPPKDEMATFEALAKGLFGVSRAALAEAEKAEKKPRSRPS
jgi:hypothetical protein